MQERQRIQALRVDLDLAVALTAAIFVTSVTSRPPCAHAQAGPKLESSAVDALPGVHEVPFALRGNDGLNARLGVGYGWTESVLQMDDSHHRLQLDAAASVTPLEWLSAAARFLGRYDTHSGGVDDDGVIVETHAGVRATFPLSASVRAGADLSLWIPSGETVANGLSATSGDLQFLLAYAPELSPLTLGLALGLRVDRSKFGAGDYRSYSAADRLALSASESILAARQGLAISYRIGRFEWIAEWAFRMYFARVAESPMWIRAGVRYRPAPRLQLELLLGVSPSKRPSLEADAPLAVVEPRLAVGLSVAYLVSGGSETSAAEVEPPPIAAPPQVETLPASLRGRVLSPSGAGIAAATVTLGRDEVTNEVTSDDEGAFALTPLPPGQYVLRVAADGFSSDQQSLELHAGDQRELDVTLKRELPRGQIRGTVRRFDGRPIVAAVSVAQLGVSQPTHADGTFEIDVPPGEYSVAVKARGFRPQTRKARVELNGVAILIVELEVAK